MGSMNYFDQVVQEILQNNYLEANFENSKLKRFCPHFLKFHRGEVFLKNALFSEL